METDEDGRSRRPWTLVRIWSRQEGLAANFGERQVIIFRWDFEIAVVMCHIHQECVREHLKLEVPGLSIAVESAGNLDFREISSNGGISTLDPGVFDRKLLLRNLVLRAGPA